MPSEAKQPAAPSGAGQAGQAVWCHDMDDVRREIDRLDRDIVALLAERQSYIEQAARIKDSRETVRDEDRVADVITKVLRTAATEGANPDMVEKVYRVMVEWCINYEFTVFDALKGSRTAKPAPFW
ncbi:MAG: chorismate mutase [Sphingomonadales bacterium]